MSEDTNWEDECDLLRDQFVDKLEGVGGYDFVCNEVEGWGVGEERLFLEISMLLGAIYVEMEQTHDYNPDYEFMYKLLKKRDEVTDLVIPRLKDDE